VDVRDPNVTFKGVPQVSVSEDLAPKDVYVLAFVDERGKQTCNVCSVLIVCYLKIALSFVSLPYFLTLSSYMRQNIATFVIPISQLY
jgi:hypothetical protein